MASRACGNRLSLRNQYDTETPRASACRASCPVRPDAIGLAELNSRHEKIYSVGFEWTPAKGSNRKCPSKISSNLGTEKISRSARITAGLKLREAARVFSTVTLAYGGRKPSGRTGSRFALLFMQVAASFGLPGLLGSGYRKQFTYDHRNEC